MMRVRVAYGNSNVQKNAAAMSDAHCDADSVVTMFIFCAHTHNEHAKHTFVMRTVHTHSSRARNDACVAACV